LLDLTIRGGKMFVNSLRATMFEILWLPIWARWIQIKTAFMAQFKCFIAGLDAKRRLRKKYGYQQ